MGQVVLITPITKLVAFLSPSLIFSANPFIHRESLEKTSVCLKQTHTWNIWVLHIAKVGYFFSPCLPNVEWPILGPLPFCFYQKLFIFCFLANCFGGPNLHNAVE